MSSVPLMASRGNITIYLPQSKRDERPMERPQKLAKQKDRLVNYLAVQAIIEYVKGEKG